MIKSVLKQVLFPAFHLLLFSSAAQQPDTKGMVLIAGGEFTMGRNLGPQANYSPAHPVRIGSFYMDTREVTNADYHRFCLGTGHRLPEFWNSGIHLCGPDYPDYPVVGISWDDAAAYAAWAGKRLPTEAEWEYAARGGLVNMEYPNGNEWNVRKGQRIAGGWHSLALPVGTDVPNGFGLYDMGGNVWEWTADRYEHDYYSVSPTVDPKGPDKGNLRVIRGGSWHSGPGCMKVYYRNALPANWCDFAVGFRCAMDAPE